MMLTVGSSQSTNVSLPGESSIFEEFGLDLVENGKLPTTWRDVVQTELVTGVFNMTRLWTAMEKAAATSDRKLWTFQYAHISARTQQKRTLSWSNISASKVRDMFSHFTFHIHVFTFSQSSCIYSILTQRLLVFSLLSKQTSTTVKGCKLCSKIYPSNSKLFRIFTLFYSHFFLRHSWFIYFMFQWPDNIYVKI